MGLISDVQEHEAPIALVLIISSGNTLCQNVVIFVDNGIRL